MFKEIKACAALVLAAAVSAPTLAASTLIGPGTLNNVDDLTIVQNGAATYEFLDLTATYGMSVDTAVSTYGGQGFHWATGAEVSVLFDAFNLDYQMTAATQQYMALATPAEQYKLASYVGTFDGAAALGWIDDSALEGYHTYVVINNSLQLTFVFNTTLFWPSRPSIGTFLVRDVTSVPVPATAWLFGSGLIGLVGAARKRSAA